MLCVKCGKNFREGAFFCGKCGSKIPTKCIPCGTIAEDDDIFCISCGKKLPESPTAFGSVDAAKSLKLESSTDNAPKSEPIAVQKPDPKPEPEPKPEPKQGKFAPPTPPQPIAPVQPELVQPKLIQTPFASNDNWKMTEGKALMEFYDTFTHKVGFTVEEEEIIDGTSFTLRAFQSKIYIWDEKKNGIKLEGFFKDTKRVSFWVNIQKNGVNDVQHQVGGKDDVVVKQLDSIQTYMEYYNPKLITAIEKCFAKYCT